MADLQDYLEFTMDRTPLFEQYYQDYSLNYGWKGIVSEKLEKAAPYYFFLTRVKDCIDTYFEDLTITFPELLDESLGILEHSVHINFLVEVPWLLAQYGANDLFLSPMTIICGIDDDDFHHKGENMNIQTIVIPPSYRFGKMHTKMSIFFYIDKSVRFVVYTANLIESDWTNRTQGVWISPRCPYMGDNIPINYGESNTLFKVDIIKYLASYDLPELTQWIFRIQKCDLSAIKVCLVASIPGEHNDDNFGYKKLNKLLRENVLSPTTKEWDYVAQCSSIGFLGQSPQAWFKTFSKSLHGNGEGDYVPAKVIFPSLDTVRRSLDGFGGANCLPYTSKIHNTQKWLRDYFQKWRCDHRHRTRAIPHIKSYARLTKDGTKLAWFLLTSANLSKAAWGAERLNGKYNGGDMFKIRKGGFVDGDKELFPLPYDVPVVPYEDTDLVFLLDKH